MVPSAVCIKRKVAVGLASELPKKNSLSFPFSIALLKPHPQDLPWFFFPNSSASTLSQYASAALEFDWQLAEMGKFEGTKVSVCTHKSYRDMRLLPILTQMREDL